MIKFNTIERYGYSVSGTVAIIKVYFDDKKVVFKYTSLIDTFLIILSMIPIIGFFVEILNNFRRLFDRINQFLKKAETIINDDEEGFEFERIFYNQIVELKFKEKTTFHSWLLYHLAFLPLVELFIFSLGSSSVIIIYLDKNKSKKKKLIFPTISLLNDFKKQFNENFNLKKIEHKKNSYWEDILFIPFNISFSLFILYLIILSILESKINANILIIFIFPFIANFYLLLSENYKNYSKFLYGRDN